MNAGRVCPPYTSSQRLDAGARVSLPDGAMYRTPSWGRGILSGAPAPRFDKRLAELWPKTHLGAIIANSSARAYVGGMRLEGSAGWEEHV